VGSGTRRHRDVRRFDWPIRAAAVQAGSYGLRKSDAAGVLQGKAVFLADALDGAHLRFFMAAQEVEEPLALDGAQLGGGQ